MQQERYQLTTTTNSFVVEFVSHGPKGSITKVVMFEELRFASIYNLAFGDKYADNGDFNDTSVTNNNDTQLVLATVAYIVQIFTQQNPLVWVIAKGNTSARNRLYQMGINKYFEKITEEYELLAETEERWEPYQKRKNYTAFAIRLKTH